MSGAITFAVNLHHDDDEMQTAMARLCSLIADDIGLDVEPLILDTPDALTDAIAGGIADFAWVSPTLLLMAPQLAHLVPLLSSVRQGATSFHSVVFTAPGSPIQQPSDLRGARAAWVAPTSASGYLVPRLTLARTGVDLATAFASETFHDTHGAVTKAVFSGRADVGATFAHFDGGDTSRTLVRAGFEGAGALMRARIIAVSGAIPADMIAAQSSVPIPARIAFAGAMCRLPHCAVGGDALRHVMGADEFAPVNHASLAELQALMAAAQALVGA